MADDYRILSAEEVKALHAAAPPESVDVPPFEQKQFDDFAEAAAERIEDPLVERIFGGEERIYLDCNVELESEARAGVEKILAEKGYTITSYKDGYATDAAGKQKFKIGKLLKDHAEVRDAFEQDSTRAGNTKIVISRNVMDIAQMSTNRQWRSCMAADGAEAYKLPGQIQHGALVAYLISDKDPDIIDPLARITIRPYMSRDKASPKDIKVQMKRRDKELSTARYNINFWEESMPKLTRRIPEQKAALESLMAKRDKGDKSADSEIQTLQTALDRDIRDLELFPATISRFKARVRELEAEGPELSRAFKRAQKRHHPKDRFRPMRAYQADKIYGLKNEAFARAVESFVENELNFGRAGHFAMVAQMPADRVEREMFLSKKPVTSKPFNVG